MTCIDDFIKNYIIILEVSKILIIKNLKRNEASFEILYIYISNLIFPKN